MKQVSHSMLVASAVVGSLALAVSAHAGGNPDKVRLCHGTASATNPYVLINVSESALPGHLDGHGWRNTPDFVLSGAFATCEDALAGEGSGGSE